MKYMKDTKNVLYFAGIIGGSLILSALIGGVSMYKMRSLDNVLSVTGSARTHVVADQVKWSASFSRVVRQSDLKKGYAMIAADLTLVKAFYASHGLDDSSITISPASMMDYYDYSSSPSSPAKEKQYSISQTITVNSSDVAGVTDIAKQSSALIDKGVIFMSSSPEYYYSGLSDLRVSLLSSAIHDARNRAEKIAESSGERVGSLRSASSGVVQVLPAHSVDVSDYGTYDTSSIDKEVMLTVKAAFSMR
ncbi:SIMPL domain-containing protein [bacterium]|nr:SIMPL domain-containing protein [bacterium]